MKPRLRYARSLWWCGIRGHHPMWWSCAPTREEAFALWERANQSDAARSAVNA
jgi:hypothetical protein